MHPVSTCSALCENFYILPEELQFFKRYTQATVSLHAPRLPAVYTPSSLQLNPQETFFLENMHILQEGTRATCCSNRTRILPEEVLMLQASNGTVRVLCI